MNVNFRKLAQQAIIMLMVALMLVATPGVAQAAPAPVHSAAPAAASGDTATLLTTNPLVITGNPGETKNFTLSYQAGNSWPSGYKLLHAGSFGTDYVLGAVSSGSTINFPESGTIPQSGQVEASFTLSDSNNGLFGPWAKVILKAAQSGQPQPPEPTATSAAPVNKVCDSRYVSDVTIPDFVVPGTPGSNIFKPGSSNVKKWTLQNTGTCTWDGASVSAVSGDTVMVSSYVVPALKPGESGTIEVTFTIPVGTSMGVKQTWFQLKDKNGAFFGVKPYAKYYVSSSGLYDGSNSINVVTGGGTVQITPIPAGKSADQKIQIYVTAAGQSWPVALKWSCTWNAGQNKYDCAWVQDGYAPSIPGTLGLPNPVSYDTSTKTWKFGAAPATGVVVGTATVAALSPEAVGAAAGCLATLTVCGVVIVSIAALATGFAIVYYVIPAVQAAMSAGSAYAKIAAGQVLYYGPEDLKPHTGSKMGNATVAGILVAWGLISTATICNLNVQGEETNQMGTAPKKFNVSFEENNSCTIVSVARFIVMLVKALIASGFSDDAINVILDVVYNAINSTFSLGVGLTYILTKIIGGG